MVTKKADEQEVSGTDAQSRQAQDSDGVDVVDAETGVGTVISAVGQKWDDKNVPNPNERKSIAEDPTGKSNVVKKSKGK